MASCKKYGIKPGLYYSVNDNYFANIKAGQKNTDPPLPGQIDITIDSYWKMMVAQLDEL